MKAFRGLGLCLMLAARAETPTALSRSGHAWYAPLPVVSPPGRPVRTPLPWDVWQQSADMPGGLLLLAGQDVHWPFALYLAQDEWSPVTLRPLAPPEANSSREAWSEAFAVEGAGLPIHRLIVEIPAGSSVTQVAWHGRVDAESEWRHVASGKPREGRLVLENQRLRFEHIRLDFVGPTKPEPIQVQAEKAQAYLLYESSSFQSLRLYYGGKPEAGMGVWASAAADTNRTIHATMRVRRPAFDGELTQRLKRPIFLGLTFMGTGVLFLLALAIQFRRNTR